MQRLFEENERLREENLSLRERLDRIEARQAWDGTSNEKNGVSGCILFTLDSYCC